jgi:hypothetical protein
MIGSAFNSKFVFSSAIFNTNRLNFRNNSKRYCDIFFQKASFYVESDSKYILCYLSSSNSIFLINL